jgi:hypothetical protein
MAKKTKARGGPKGSRVTVKKPVKPKPPKLLTRRNLIKPADTNETHEDVQRALTAAQSSSDLKGKLKLSRDSIVIAEQVFQWRLLGTDVVNREDHILGMANAIADGGEPLAAILVLPVGDRFYVVDGHHRLAAYDTAQWSRAIPAEVFGGTLPEARREALRLNSRNKLPMTKDDKQEAAWRLVKQGLGREQIHEWTGASTSNVSKMKAKLSKLRDRGRTTEELGALTWVQARGDWTPEERDFDVDAWQERKADKLVDAMQKAHIGHMLRKQPEITAMALEKLDANLPEALMKQWVYRLDPEFLVGFITEQLDEEAARAWTALQTPKKF